MNRSELVGILSSRFPELGAGDVDASVRTIVDAIGNSLTSGNRVEIRGFGTFNVTVRPSRSSRNPKTGEPVQVPQKATPRFKPGQMLRERVNSPHPVAAGREKLAEAERTRLARGAGL